YTSGHDVYYEYSGTESITLASGYTSAVYYKIGNDLKIVFDSENSIIIVNQYNGAVIETLDFDGGPSVDLTAVSPIVQGDESANNLYGTAYVDDLSGYGGNDLIYGYAGDDILSGGTGNDTLV